MENPPTPGELCSSRELPGNYATSFTCSLLLSAWRIAERDEHLSRLQSRILMHTPFLNSLLKQAASFTFPKPVIFRVRQPPIAIHYASISRFVILPPVFYLHPPLSDALSFESHPFFFSRTSCGYVHSVESFFYPICTTGIVWLRLW